MSFTNYGENKVLGAIYAGVAYTGPATLYIALFTTAPTMPAGTGAVEVSGGAYARVAVTASSGMTVSGTSPTQVVNAAAINFATATAAWGTVVAAGIYDASTGGNMIQAGTLSPSKTIGSGDTFTFAAGQYKITLV